MKDPEKEIPTSVELNTKAPSTDGPSLFARYGAELDIEALSVQQKQEFLIALWNIMSAFVDLGLSVKSGENFSEHHDRGMNDVLQYLHLEATAHETVAPRFTPNAEEH